MLKFDTLRMEQQPYPFGVAQAVFDPEIYNQLVVRWPAEHLFSQMAGKGYKKLSLSERNYAEAYKDFIHSDSLWTNFYQYIKSEKFREDVFSALGRSLTGLHFPFSSRFEFSSMPANGGMIAPHRDIASKVLTLVIPMYFRTTWNASWGGGTDILSPKDLTTKLQDYQAPLSEFIKVHTVQYIPNQCLLFIKSDNSWHSAGPFTGPEGKWRRTLTINIERK